MGKLIKLNNNTGLKVRAKAEDSAEIIVYGVIGDSFRDEGISAESFSDELKALGNVKNIDVRINSVGGDVFDGITIYNRLKQHKAKITVHVDGLAASIASIIMLAGDEVILGEGSLVMIHKPWTGAYGNSNDLESVIDRLDDVEEQLLSIYAKKTGMDRTELKTMLANETWMDSDEAIEKGFADSKADADEFRIAACANVPWSKNMPKVDTSNKLVKNKLDDLNKLVEGFIARK